MKFATLVKLAALPVLLICIVLSLFLARSFFQLPTDEELRQIVRELFERYGLLIVFMSALIEGIFVVGWYFPGTTVILFCLLFVGDRLSDVTVIALAASLGLSCAYSINFLIGKYGWYRLLSKFGFQEALDRAKDRVKSHGVFAIGLSYWQFSLASLISTAAGILQMRPLHFILVSAFSTFFWVGFWSALIFASGSAAMTLVGLPFILFVMLAWIIIAICMSLLRARSGQDRDI